MDLPLFEPIIANLHFRPISRKIPRARVSRIYTIPTSMTVVTAIFHCFGPTQSPYRRTRHEKDDKTQHNCENRNKNRLRTDIHSHGIVSEPFCVRLRVSSWQRRKVGGRLKVRRQDQRQRRGKKTSKNSAEGIVLTHRGCITYQPYAGLNLTTDSMNSYNT